MLLAQIRDYSLDLGLLDHGVTLNSLLPNSPIENIGTLSLPDLSPVLQLRHLSVTLLPTQSLINIPTICLLVLLDKGSSQLLI